MAFFGGIVALPDRAPIDGRHNRGGGAALTLRRNGSGGTGGMRGGRRMRRGGGDMEGPRHASNGYAGEDVIATHDVDPPFAQKDTRAV
ncbi:hypothetical protein [Mycobacterium sp. 852002-51961_SCH5331710]|uniref:hypothetical protein n=1 Tax=Mycobacterium sp. 852002-51961_SCH5331710 TaxID=1834105 RepID=UPI0012E88364|nr:hypothetical protein [Mycobacterium sp. 852002-51961_SCH5331710]